MPSKSRSRAHLERLRRLPDLLVRAELVEVVVGGDQLFVAELGDTRVELVARLRYRVEAGGGVGILGGAARNPRPAPASRIGPAASPWIRRRR